MPAFTVYVKVKAGPRVGGITVTSIDGEVTADNIQQAIANVVATIAVFGPVVVRVADKSE